MTQIFSLKEFIFFERQFLSNHNDPHWARRARLAREIGGAEGQDGRTSHILIDLQEDSTRIATSHLGQKSRSMCVE